jgi:hypothetical protein
VYRLVKKQGSQVFGGDTGLLETTDLGYVSLNRNISVKGKELRLFKVYNYN